MPTNTKNAQMTPARNLHLRFDHADTVAVEPAFAMIRSAHEIARGGVGPNNAIAVVQLSTGGWQLQASWEIHSNITEFGDVLGSVIRPSEYTLAASQVTMPRSRPPSDIPGAVPNPAFVGGDNFQVAAPGAGQTYASSLDADVAIYAQAAPAGGNAMNRVAFTKKTYDPNQSFAFRFEIPNNGVQTSQYFCDLMFADYAIGFYGDGRVTLNQAFFVDPKNPSKYIKWVLRDSWKIGSVANMRGHHVMRISPHVNPLTGIGYIEFDSDTIDSAPVIGGGLAQATPNSKHVYQTRPLPLDPNQATSTDPSLATVAGKLRVNHLGHWRLPWQVQVPRFQSPGTLIDQAFFVPFPMSTRAPLVLRWTAEIPAGTTLDGKLFDAVLQTELTQTGGGTSYKIYAPTRGQNHYYAVFTLTTNADHSATPRLWSYQVQRDGVLASTALAPFVTPDNGGILHNVSISGPERDPSHESMAFEFDDVTLAYPALGVRGGMRVRLETEYDSSDRSLRSVLFDGYVGKAIGKRRTGRLREGFSGGQLRQYPSPYWKRYSVTCAGMWQRLHEGLTMTRLNYAIDQNAETDPATKGPFAWKVTDAIRQLISYAGFNVATQIDVPDSSVRFFATSDGNGSQLTLDPLANIAEVVGRYARDYLGWFLCWDANAGASGMWRLVKPSIPPYQNLAIFRTGAAGGGLAHLASTYNIPSTSAYVGSLTGPVTGFIRRGTLSSWVVPPEGNLLYVTGSGQLLPNGGGLLNLSNFAVNPLSCDFLADAAGNLIHTADPNNPDYLGRVVPIVLYDAGLSSPNAVALVIKRVYQQACQAIKMMSFDAPLLLVVDPRDLLQNHPRPLRYYDAVQVVSAGVTSQWLVRNCNPYITKSGFMWAHYELEAPRNVLPGT